jgi:ABC-type nickel/cobalt efflux system permease component RcnA
LESYALVIIFWYGILHAFGPDHLTAIADFSIGKSKKKTLIITTLFAVGHGITLFLFAKILQTFHISDAVLGYGDTISSLVIISMGVFLLYMVKANKIHLKTHNHDGKKHIHIWFGDEHKHDSKDSVSAFSIGMLMGIGGVRGMLITLGVVESQNVDFMLVGAFTLGVMVIFVGFGGVILYINQNLLNSKQNVRRVFTTAGIISLVVGSNMILG